MRLTRLFLVLPGRESVYVDYVDFDLIIDAEWESLRQHPMESKIDWMNTLLLRVEPALSGQPKRRDANQVKVSHRPRE